MSEIDLAGPGSWDSPAGNAAAVTPDDTNGLDHPTRGIYVGGSGDVNVVMETGSTVLFKQAVAGSVLPIRVTQVLDTGTTASSLVALW